MSKRVEFERYRYTDPCHDWLDVEVHYDASALALRVTDDGVVSSVVFTDPAKLDALADAIKRAADALRKAQTETVDDLPAGTWFRYHDESPYVVRHKGRTRTTTFCGDECKATCNSEMNRSLPVVRLRATFEPVGSP